MLSEMLKQSTSVNTVDMCGCKVGVEGAQACRAVGGGGGGEACFRRWTVWHLCQAPGSVMPAWIRWFDLLASRASCRASGLLRESRAEVLLSVYVLEHVVGCMVRGCCAVHAAVQVLREMLMANSSIIALNIQDEDASKETQEAWAPVIHSQTRL